MHPITSHRFETGKQRAAHAAYQVGHALHDLIHEVKHALVHHPLHHPAIPFPQPVPVTITPADGPMPENDSHLSVDDAGESSSRPGNGWDLLQLQLADARLQFKNRRSTAMQLQRKLEHLDDAAEDLMRAASHQPAEAAQLARQEYLRVCNAIDAVRAQLKDQEDSDA